jgi:DNA/RNA endonuclease YhcR with UshA esterase domain
MLNVLTMSSGLKIFKSKSQSSNVLTRTIMKPRIILASFGLLVWIAATTFSQTTLYYENFNSSTTSLPAGWSATAGTSTWAASTSSASSGYTGASGSTNIVATNNAALATLSLTYANNLSTVGYTNITVLWGGRRTSTFTNSVTFEWSTDGTTWNAVAYTEVANNGTWALVNGGTRISLPAGAEGASNLRFRWTYTQLNNAGNYRIDDFSVQGTAPLSDGDGTATITNAIGSGVLNNSDVFPRNSPGQSVKIALTGTSTGTLAKASVTIPSTWTWTGNAADVSPSIDDSASLTNETISGDGSSGNPWVIQYDGSITNSQIARITISNLSTPNPTDVTNDGNYFFVVKTAKTAGTLTSIVTSPKCYVVVPIANIRDVDGNGIPNDLNKTVAVQGVATIASGVLSTTTLQVFLQDGTGGVNIFRSGTPPTVTAGNEYIVKGTVIQFNGLTEVNPNLVTDIIDLGASTQPAPQTKTIAQLLANAEQFEGSLVKINNATKVSGTWPTTNTFTNLTITDSGGTDTLVLRINSATGGSAEPTYPVNIVGIISQSDNSSPYTDSYQIFPRSAADIVPVTRMSSLNKTSINFGDVHFAEVKTDSIQIKNTGTATLNITNASSNDTLFFVAPSVANIAPSDSAMFYVVFVGLDTGAVAAKIVFTHNGASVKDTVNVSAVGKMGISSLDKSAITIGTIAVNTSKTDSVVMTNRGNDSLRVMGVVSSMPTVFSVSPMVTTLGVGSAQKFIITATLDSAKQRKATIYFVHDGKGLIDSVQVTLNSTTGVTSSRELPKSFELSQNYPNPFNPATTIEFALPQKEFVTLRVYNLLGQEVAMLLNGEMSAGRHSVRWDGTNGSGRAVPSGIYVYRLRAGEFDQTRRMVLLK